MSNAETLILTANEVGAVLNMRALSAERAAAQAFRSKALATAHAFDRWSSETGQGLTFSTFVNAFGYEDADGRQMFEALERIFKAAAYGT